MARRMLLGAAGLAFFSIRLLALSAAPGEEDEEGKPPVTAAADVVVTAQRPPASLDDVTDPAESLIGVADSASQGIVGARQLESRPILRGGDLLESVPGLAVSQHSGEGKANQYYLRGFNLDHGTDFATSVA